MLLSNTFMALALASSIAAAPADLWKRAQVVLGYRTVDKAEADKINAVGAPIWDNVDYGGGKQLGTGVYTSPGPGDWKKGPDAWICVIWCDSDALDRVSKAWVPSKWNKERLWWEENKVDKYITNSLESSWDPAKTLRMSFVEFFYPTLQLLIPPALVDASGSMNFQAKCVEKQSDLPTTSRVDYDSWQNNIRGSRWPGSDPVIFPPTEE